MDTVTAIKGLLAGIAAQGAVTVTIPNDSEIVREMGPIEINRQLGPIKLRVRTAPGKYKVQTAPAEPKIQAAPVEPEPQAAPAEPKTQAAPAQTDGTNQAPTEGTDQAPPAKSKSQPAPAKLANRAPATEIPNTAAPVKQTGYEGLWYDHSGRSAIRIKNCGAGLCGQIAWLKNSAHKSVCGTDIIGGVRKVGSVYDNGWIYDIERGRKFDVELKLLNENKLRVKGYAGTKLFSKTMIWRRAPSDLVLCS